MKALEWHGEDLILSLRVQPRAARDEFVPHGDGFKLRITAPPVDGQANAHLIKYLAKAFAVPRSHVELLSGESGRDKRFRVRAPRQVPAELEQALS